MAFFFSTEDSTADNLRIGATVDIGAINEGMASAQEITRAASDGIAISFEECSAKTRSAMVDFR